MEQLHWRKRIGLITTSGQVVTEPRYYQLAPPGVTFHTSRMLHTGGPDGLIRMEENAPRAVEELVTADVDAIAYCCTVSGAMRGIEDDRGFCDDIWANTGIPVTSTMLACAEALQHLGARRIVLTSPYVDSHNEHEAIYLREAGIEPVLMRGMGLTSGKQYCRVTPDEIRKFCLDAWQDAYALWPDALFISCMNYDAISVAENIEQIIGKPVVTSHTATLWRALAFANIPDPIDGAGALLAETR